MFKSTSALHAAIRKDSGWNLHLAEHQGAIWVTNSYWLFKIADEKHLMARLLAEFNLPLEPMVIDVTGRTLRRTDQKAADVGKLIPAERPKDSVTLTPHSVRGVPVLVRRDGQMCEVWEGSDGRLVTIDTAKVGLLDSLVGQAETWWQGERDTMPAVRCHAGGVQSLVMPVRTIWDEVARKKAA